MSVFLLLMGRSFDESNALEQSALEYLPVVGVAIRSGLDGHGFSVCLVVPPSLLGDAQTTLTLLCTCLLDTAMHCFWFWSGAGVLLLLLSH